MAKMPPMKRANSASKPPMTEPSTASLRLSGPSERFRAAQRSHDKLVEQVARRRRDLDRLMAAASATMTAVAGRVGPLAAEWRRIDELIHTLFPSSSARSGP